MKITIDDIRKMVKESICLINEKYDDLTDLFKQNHNNIENGTFTFQNVDQTKYRTSEDNFNKKLSAYRKLYGISTANRIQSARLKAEKKEIAKQNKYKAEKNYLWDLLFDTFGVDASYDDVKNIISNYEQFKALATEPYGSIEYPIKKGTIRANRKRYRERHPDERARLDAKQQENLLKKNEIYANFIPILKDLFVKFGGDTLNKNDEDYVKNICLIARRVRYMQEGRPKTPKEKPFLQDDNSVFYDFYQVYLASIKAEYNIKNEYLLFCTQKIFHLPLTAPNLPEYNERYKQEIEKLVESGSIARNKCTDFLTNINIANSDNTETSLGNISALASFLFNSNEVFVYQELQTLCNLIKEQSTKNRIMGPSSITCLSDVLWLVVYIMSYKSYNLIDIVNDVKEKYGQTYLPFVCKGFKFLIANAYGGVSFLRHKNIVSLSHKVGDNVLYNPFMSLTNFDVQKIIHEVGILGLENKTPTILLPFVQVIDCSEDLSFIMETVNMENYNGISFDIKTILDPNFTATKAMKIIEENGGKCPDFNENAVLGVIGENGVEHLTFFDYLRFTNSNEPKTQKNIYMFLTQNSKYKWVYEYNRYTKQKNTKRDNDLGLQSIDMLCTNPNNQHTYAVEYQGEQHFRPFRVPPTRDNFLGIDVIKNTIFEKIKEMGNISEQQVKKNIKPFIYETLLNQAKIYMNDESIDSSYYAELYDFLSNVKYNNNLFTKESSSKFPFYILSPLRFMGEVDVYYNKQRDKVKIKSVQRKGPNWRLIYILPGSTSISESDRKYAESIVGLENIFYWNSNGKQQIIRDLLQKEGLYNDNVNIGNNQQGSLFEQIVKEAFKQNNRF